MLVYTILLVSLTKRVGPTYGGFLKTEYRATGVLESWPGQLRDPFPGITKIAAEVTSTTIALKSRPVHSRIAKRAEAQPGPASRSVGLGNIGGHHHMALTGSVSIHLFEMGR